MKNSKTTTEKLNEITNEWNFATPNQRVGMIGEGNATINKEHNVFFTHLNFSQLSDKEKEVVINAL